MNARQQACAEPVTPALACKREPGHPGVHETYVDGRTITAPNDRGWRVAQWEDEDGDYWCLVNGAFTDPAKYDTREAAEFACDIANRRGKRPQDGEQ